MSNFFRSIYYYIKDHLGNIRVAVNDGVIDGDYLDEIHNSGRGGLPMGGGIRDRRGRRSSSSVKSRSLNNNKTENPVINYIFKTIASPEYATTCVLLQKAIEEIPESSKYSTAINTCKSLIKKFGVVGMLHLFLFLMIYIKTVWELNILRT